MFFFVVKWLLGSISCVMAISAVDDGQLRQSLNTYDIVTIRETHLYKRDLNSEKTVRIRALGREYSLRVHPGIGLWDRNFRLTSNDGTEFEDEEIHEDILHGTVYGCTFSWVRLMKTKRGLIGSFSCEDDVIYVEPASLHIKTVPANASLIYRDRDVLPLNAKMTEPVKPPQDKATSPLCENPFHNGMPWSSSVMKRRSKREGVITKNRCPLKIILDHVFFDKIANKSRSFSMRYVVNMIDRVNNIFTNIDFGDNYKNFGFSIKEIVILDKPNSDRNHYNSDKNWVNLNTMLESFNRFEATQDACIVILFTARQFENSGLGMAYVDAVCGPRKDRPFNVMISTMMKSNGDDLQVTRTAELVVSHELGHLWGASHDRDVVCSPSLDEGGKYIMNDIAVAGYDPNNSKFSNCSIGLMRKALEERSEHCFVEEQEARCGNGVVEKGEECDEGFLFEGETDPCCRKCRLLAGAQCSPRNELCCSQICKYQEKGFICKHKNLLQCSMESVCTGVSGQCPEPSSTPDGSLCIDGGECRNGECLPWCERRAIGKKACMCSAPMDMCKRCCRNDNTSESCRPEREDEWLRDGTFCILGTCQKRMCQRGTVDAISHFRGLLQNVNSSNWGPLLKSNIAFAIIFLSLCLFVPAGFCVASWDKRTKNINRPGVKRVEAVNDIPLHTPQHN